MHKVTAGSPMGGMIS